MRQVGQCAIDVIQQVGHEDESPEICISEDVLDELEEEELLDSGHDYEPEGLSEMEEKLKLPRDSEDPPHLKPADLSSLDALAEVVEIERLKKLGVLLDPMCFRQRSRTSPRGWFKTGGRKRLETTYPSGRAELAMWRENIRGLSLVPTYLPPLHHAL